MRIFSLIREQNSYEVSVYESLEDFSCRTEWQDVLGNYFTIIDIKGNIYKWDQTKNEELATSYNYTLKIVKVDKVLGELCEHYFKLNNFANEFKFEL